MGDDDEAAANARLDMLQQGEQDAEDEEEDEEPSSSIVLHEDKKYYPTAEETFGAETETLVMEEDAQPLEVQSAWYIESNAGRSEGGVAACFQPCLHRHDAKRPRLHRHANMPQQYSATAGVPAGGASNLERRCISTSPGTWMQVPIIAPLRHRKVEVLEREAPETNYSNEFLAGLLNSSAVVTRNIAVVGHLHHGKTTVRRRPPCVECTLCAASWSNGATATWHCENVTPAQWDTPRPWSPLPRHDEQRTIASPTLPPKKVLGPWEHTSPGSHAVSASCACQLGVAVRGAGDGHPVSASCACQQGVAVRWAGDGHARGADP